MLTLYYKETCPFSQRVLQMSENLGVKLDLKDITDNEQYLAELMEKGGEKQVPFLEDTDRDVKMYESNDIIEYLRENYAGTKESSEETRPRVHVGGSVCESCEG